jgi:hypothetical protein
MMIRNENFLLQEVAGSQVLVPVGEAVAAFAGMLTLSSSGVHLWNALETEHTAASLVTVLLERYEVTREQASADVEKFIATLRSVGAVKD